MKTLVAALGLTLAALSAPAQTESCGSAKSCLARAEHELLLREWRKAEDYAAEALDWAEPTDAALAYDAYRIAADAALADGRPRMALEWVNAGVKYRGPWTDHMYSEEHVSRVNAGKERQQLLKSRDTLMRTVAGLPTPSMTGRFVKYAGRGLWDELTLNSLPAGRVRWELGTERVGDAVEPVRLRSVAQIYEGKGEATWNDNSFRFSFNGWQDDGCDGVIQVLGSTANVELPKACLDPTRTAGRYVRVER